MDDSVWGLILTAIINSIILLILFFIFAGCRTMRSKPVNAEIENVPVKNPPFDESQGTLSEIFKKVWEVDRGEFAEKLGAQGSVYLHLHYYISYALLVMTILSWAILIPVYLTGDGDINLDIEETGLSHVINDEMLLIAPLLVFVLYWVCMYYFIFKFIQKAIKGGNQSPDSGGKTIAVWGLKKDMDYNTAQSSFEQSAQNMFKSGNIESVQTFPEFSKAYQYELQLKEARRQVQHFLDYQTYKGERAQIKVKCKKVDAIEFYQAQVQDLESHKLKAIQEHQYKNTGFGFVTFANKDEAEEAVKLFQKTGGDLKKVYKVNMAPTPGEVKWQNLNVNQKKIGAKRCWMTTFFVILFMFVMTPSAFLSFVGGALDSIGIPQVIAGLFSSYLPMIIMIIYMSVILPMVINYLAGKELHSGENEEVISKMGKYLIFHTGHLFLSPLLGMQAWTLVEKSIDGAFDELGQDMANQLTASGWTFSNFILGLAFLTNGLDLAQIAKWILVKLKMRSAVSAQEQELAYQCDPFNFPKEYATALNSFNIILSFSIVFPVILPIGLVFFVLRYHIHKYNLLCIYVTEKAGDSKPITINIATALLVGVLMFTVDTSVMFMFSGHAPYLVVGGILLLIALVLNIVLLIFTKYVLGLLFKKFKVHYDSVGPTVGEESYKHPLLEEQQGKEMQSANEYGLDDDNQA